MRQCEGGNRRVRTLMASIGGVFFALFVPRGAHQLESGGTLMRVVGGLSFQSRHVNGGVCMVQMLFWMDMCGMVDSGGWEVGGCWLGKGNQHVVQEGQL